MISILALAAALQGARPVAAPPAPPAPPRSGPSQTARARTNLASYVTAEDYPAEAVFNGEQGTVGFRLVVDPGGQVSSCQVTLSSGAASLDEITCRIMVERARFTPARDAGGRPMSDSVGARITWRLAEDAPVEGEEEASPGPRRPSERARPMAPLASLPTPTEYREMQTGSTRPGVTAFELSIGTDGRVTDCAIRAPSGSAFADAQACRIVRQRSRFTPARDAYGNPMPDLYQGHIGWAPPSPPAPGR